eukprot:CAMPEP_0170510974 /NCGR_PEP_ID=MMETSP0208-20121228/66050_1 /TAXON_ID=197538 /ORGANISM="Strombidium inclinatum, Strain S3" /LENGTH=52 /DNA_ID=CAMNT_0010794473 /DNA_START=1517 /DNA_END=1675 /DNA_ORIENTATION=+
MAEYIPNSLCRQMGSTISLYSNRVRDMSDSKPKKSVFSAPGEPDRKGADYIS